MAFISWGISLGSISDLVLGYNGYEKHCRDAEERVIISMVEKQYVMRGVGDSHINAEMVTTN